MLARAAKRKLRRDAFRAPSQVSEPLTLPWLYPPSVRWAASLVPAHDASRKQKMPPSVPSRHETRSLATAADMTSHPAPMPFNGMMQPWGSRIQAPDLARLNPGDPTKPLIIHTENVATIPTTRLKAGIGGTALELHQNLYACLRVRRLDRARAIIQRLMTLLEPSAPEIVDAHNRYLHTMIELAEQNPSPRDMDEIEHWYHMEMVNKAVCPDAGTYVLLLRAALNFLSGGRRDDALQNYLGLASSDGPEVLEAINQSGDFTDHEWETLIKFQSDSFDDPPPVEDYMDMQMSTPAGQALIIEHGLIPDPALNIKSVPQKGMGLSTLQNALSMFEPGQRLPYPHERAGTEEEKDRAYAYMRQIRLEEDATRAATERWQAEDAKLQEMGIHGVLQSKPLQALMWNWYSALLPRLQQELELIKDALNDPSSTSTNDERLLYGPYLEECDIKTIAALTVQRVISASMQSYESMDGRLKVITLTTLLGKEVEKEYTGGIKQRHEAFLRKQRRQTRKELVSKLTKQKPAQAPQPKVASGELDRKRSKIPLPVRTKLGAMLLDLLLQTATIKVTAEDPKTGKQLSSTQRAFTHQKGYHHGKKIGFISVHTKLQEKLRSEPVNDVSTVRLPMLVEPKPWTAIETGAYFTHREMAVRAKPGDDDQIAYVSTAIDNGDMRQMLAGLDSLGRVPWNINGDVLRVIAEAWNAGEGIAALVPEKDNLERPVEPPSDATTQERYAWNKAMKEYDNFKAGLHSQRCFQNFQLEVARAFLGEKFYFPHSVDFRGRAYPIPPTLNHIGADMARGLLKFANGKELGTVGLQWLKIHLANLYGFDKASLKEREQFAMDNLDEVIDSATNPLGGNRWWAKAEDPWQCLACCMELKSALEAPDPTRHVSHLPVHQDGTCNGLQHYAALGGDKAGADQVNLEPSDRPQDIYTGVAELVKEMVSEDAKAGNAYAKFIDGKITRKVVKRTVMTNVYGVTFIGAQLQVLDELKAIFPNFEPANDIFSLKSVASYIAKYIFKALGQIFNSAQEIQYWLGECGERITTSITAEQVQNVRKRYEGHTLKLDSKYKMAKKMTPTMQRKLEKDSENFKTGIIWTTPLKMPVVQPYFKDAKKKVATCLQTVAVGGSSTTSTVDKRKQLQGFPPNFIHSLDASHMILSALKCSEMGLEFAAVHDSFWTHAADISNLNIVLRDAFIRMHSEDIIGRLAAEFRTRYAGHMYRSQVYASTVAGRKIMEWRTKQSKSRVPGPSVVRLAPLRELALEAQRQELLNSEDPEKRKQGEEMVTPTSIFLAEKDPLAVASYRLDLMGREKDAAIKKSAQQAREAVLSAEAATLETDPSAAAAAAIKPVPLDVVESLAAEDQEENTVFDEYADMDEEHEDADVEEQPSTEMSKDSKKVAGYMQKFKVFVWLPLSFPPVPGKGDWKVERLKDSQYFFS
ncbi:DNA-directed RNA polymerase mitochondrial precursor [Polyplosphaeria fusca]|uniref:DNA-directed RNA polymerase n=1 Tax=Polyplosphaeria fusca TaxID=682080 RepID=A0A9P4QVX9_9PLEO|nr:DNA-directed RNA polymerase mitochondrial precursor [Polyplosphaeria fusca]